MASDVTILCRPHTQIALPPLCCYCLEPAIATYPVFVWRQKIRTGPHTKAKISYPIQVPYCAAHARQARLFGQYDRLSTIALFVAALLLLVGVQLTLGSSLRSNGALVWWCATVLVLGVLALGGAGIYAVGRRLLRRRYPAMAGHYYTGSLGVTTHTRAAGRPAMGSELLLAITFTFSNDDFAVRVAELHACQGAMVGTAADAGLLTGVAPGLSAAGVPVVIGMQLTMRDKEAMRASEVIYRDIAAGRSVQEAVSRARQALYFEQQDQSAWYVPALYICTRDTGPVYV